MYEIPLTVGLRYRTGVRRQLQEAGMEFTEERHLLDSRFVIRTACTELRRILLEEIEETTARRVLA